MNKKNLLILIGSFFPLTLQAYTVPPVCLAPTLTELGKTMTDTPALNAVYVGADNGTLSRDGVSELSGDVIIQRNQQRLNADNVNFDKQKNYVDAKGNVLLSTDTTTFQSDNIEYDLVKETGVINNAKYHFKGGNVNGSSSRIVQKNKDEIELEKATYTTCSAVDPSWHIASDKISINQATQVGSARNLTLKIGKIPIFYFPWISFPLNNPFTGQTERKSGFLRPEIGFSDQSGYEVTIPYYLNLAPNYDATIYATPLSERGIKIRTVGRFLTEKSRGQLEYSFIPKDEALNDEWRDYFKLSYQRNMGHRRNLIIKAEGVLDTNYIADLSNTLELSSTSYLERSAKYTVGSTNWNYSLVALDYQVLDNVSKPYSKLPEFTLNYNSPKKPYGLDLSLSTQTTYFESSRDPTGLRVDVGMKATKKFGTEGWYVQPSMAYRTSHYSLKNNTNGNTLNRNIPTFNIDSGLALEGDINSRFKQTHEPRLSYTYTPYVDQSSIPIFDSALTTPSTINQFFATNRFTGKDRIGDTNQVALSLTSRINETKSGTEVFKARIGQVFYFDDRKVTLPNGSALTNKSTGVAMELTAKVSKNTRLTTTSFFEPDISDVISNNARINYDDKQGKLLNLSYQHTAASNVSEIDTSFALPINKKWRLLGKVDYDLSNDRVLEQLGGIEYIDCCLSSRLVARRYLSTDNINYTDAIFFEFNFKGLGGYSTGGVDTILKKSIYGYK